jgi:hypothetical protein
VDACGRARRATSILWYVVFTTEEEVDWAWGVPGCFMHSNPICRQCAGEATIPVTLVFADDFGEHVVQHTVEHFHQAIR